MINLIDIGARGGISSPWKREYIDFLMLCDADAKMDKDGKCRVLEECIYRDNEERLFYVYKKESTSSLFKPDLIALKKMGKSKKSLKLKYTLKETKNVKCCRLDTILNDCEESYNFIKSDAQGADLDVLQGMGKYIDNIIGVHCECHLFPEYIGIPLFDDICSFLREHGLKPSRVIKKKKKWVDILFVRDEISEEREFIDDIYRQYLPYTKSLEVKLLKNTERYRRKVGKWHGIKEI